MNELPESWRIFIAHYPLFKELECRLAAEPWWGDGWVYYTGHFEEGIFLQIFKPGWHNRNLRGIHLESWITIDGLASGSLPVVLHAEPETPSRDRFNILLHRYAKEMMEGWPGRIIPAGDDPTERYSVRLPLEIPGLADRLTEELRRMIPIGAIIDRVLSELDAGITLRQ